MANAMKLTDEQTLALAYFRMGMTLRVEAGAGSGKTSTLRMMAEATKRIGQFTAFSKACVVDAAGVMPETVGCATGHSLAFRAVGKKYSHRLSSGRMRSDQVARALGVTHFGVKFGAQSKTLAPGFLASLVQRTITRFCQSADPVPSVEHVPYLDGIDLPGANGERTWENNRAVRAHIAPAIERCWADISDPKGTLPYRHDNYMKSWALGDAVIPSDFILLDEAQDTAPVLLDVIARQDAQLVAVGDSCQAIYEWRGARNALALLPAEATAFLSQSWRFGQPIADVANLVLTALDAELRLTGAPTVESEVRRIDGDPDAVLCRSNAEAVTTVLRYQKAGVRVHLVGGGDDVASFARAAQELMDVGRTWHPELACFDSWLEVLDYVAADPQGGELKLLVSLVEEFTVPVILEALEKMPPENRATVVISTAHRAKGREWNQVRLASDFQEPDGDDSAGEFRLLYVAATRARRVLDVTQCEPLRSLVEPRKAKPRRSPLDMETKAWGI